MEYNVINGQITIEAGQLYKAYKNGNVKVLPETIGMFYDEKKAYIRYCGERYSQNHYFYDLAHEMACALLDGDYSKAQKSIEEIEADEISRAGRKSPFYKYRKEEN